MDAISCREASSCRERSFWEEGDYMRMMDGAYVKETLLGKNGIVCGRGKVGSLDVGVEIVQNGSVLLDGEWDLVLRFVGVDVEEVRQEGSKENGMMRLLDRLQKRLRALEHRFLLDCSHHRQQQEEAELRSKSVYARTRKMEPIQFPSFTPCVNACCTVVRTSETKPLCFPLSIATRTA